MVENGFDIRAIVTPSIKEGMERLRICIHSYNDQNQISAMLGLLKNQLQ
jgi:8-amino-7-oxononanoate synthase